MLNWNRVVRRKYYLWSFRSLTLSVCQFRSECREVIHLCIAEQKVQWIPTEDTCVYEYVNGRKDSGPQNLQDIFPVPDLSSLGRRKLGKGNE